RSVPVLRGDAAHLQRDDVVGDLAIARPVDVGERARAEVRLDLVALADDLADLQARRVRASAARALEREGLEHMIVDVSARDARAAQHALGLRASGLELASGLVERPVEHERELVDRESAREAQLEKNGTAHVSTPVT